MSPQPSSTLSLPELEEKILAYWKENNVFEKSLKKEAPRGNFVFYEGPPTANGKPAIHHVEGRAFKDLIPRYKTMQGFRVERKGGWDTHGLPVELEVEKELGLKNKKEVENYGIGSFNKKCKESVWKYQETWEQMTERIGYWLDTEHAYVTYHPEYIETLWWIIKETHERQLLYRGHRVVPQCPRCGTALSSHEVAQGYQVIKEPSVFVKFKLKKGQKIDNFVTDDHTYILAWTTTPWTLPGNAALAVKKNIKYRKVYIEDVTGEHSLVRKGETYIFVVLEDNLGKIFNGKVVFDKNIKVIAIDNTTITLNHISEFLGKDLIGLEYEPLFPGVLKEQDKNFKNAFKVYPADFVSTEDGTGVVHTAVMYGADDYELGEKIGLPKIHSVNPDGTFNERVPKWRGRFVKDTEKEIIQALREQQLLFDTQNYEHDYPFCWRCKTPLLYYAKDSWFFRMSGLRDELIANNETINWYPEHIKNGRFGEWLREIKDWAISRERYWGTPLPIWVCENTNCNEMVVIGSFEELTKLSGKKIDDPHRPFIDKITFPCQKCRSSMKRVPEVMDVWFDSGAMPFAQVHYPFENKNLIDSGKAFPADFISEGLDQTRGWFYTLLAVATMLGRQAPYKNVICLGLLLDEHGKKMSKSIGNVINYQEIIDQYGADSLRWYLYTMNQPGDSKCFSERELKDTTRLFTTLLNVVQFYKTFAGNLEIECVEEKDLTDVLDLWIVHLFNKLLKETTTKLDQYDITGAARGIGDFITELSTWYVRRSRDRFKSNNPTVKMPALKTLRRVIFNVARLLAPFTPFIAEHIYSEEMNGGESVHLTNWPEGMLGQNSENNDVLLTAMDQARKIVSLILEQREKAKIPVRQPLAGARIFNFQFSIFNEGLQDFRDSCHPERSEGSSPSGDLRVNSAYLRPSAWILPPTVTVGVRMTRHETPGLIQLIKDETNVKEIEFIPGKGELAVELDTTLSEELETEGLLREITRGVNALRKKEGLTINDIVDVMYAADDALAKIIEAQKKTLAAKTLSRTWKPGEFDGMTEVKMKEYTLKILFQL